MAVEEKETPSGGSKKETPKKQRQRNLLIAGGVGIAGVLLLAHKGGGSSGSGNATEDAALEQAAANLRAAQESGSILAGASPGTSEGSSGGDSNPGNQTGGITSPSPGVASPEPVSVTPAGAGEETLPGHATGANPLRTGAGAAKFPLTNPKTGQHYRDVTKKGKKAHEYENGRVVYLRQGATKSKPKAKAKPKDLAKGHPTKAHHRDGSGGSGVTVDGRHFPGATGVSRGGVTVDGNGNHVQNITIHEGGRTKSVQSINKGQRFIDHPRGTTPPSRGVPHVSSPSRATKPASRKPAPKKAPAKKSKPRR